MKDVSGFIGQVRRVTDEESGRTVTVTIGDGGPLQAADGRKLWDGRQVLTLTVSFDDGKRSDWRTADAAAGQVAEAIFKPYSVGMLGNDSDGAPRIDREVRKDGPKNGRTSFTFFTWCGPLDYSGKYAAMDEAGVPLETILAQIQADHAALARGEHVPTTYKHRPFVAQPGAHREAMFELMRAAHR